MKLKTEFQDEDFKLGEVADVNIATMPDGRIKAQAVAKSGGVHTFFYDDLKTFTDDWEDVPEEPKDFWFIDPEILIACESTDPLLCDKKVAIETMKQIGNYFDSREEAEKAVEKLKAWKRLKDKGFRFIDHIDRDSGQGITRYEWDGYVHGEDLDLLFSQEDD